MSLGKEAGKPFIAGTSGSSPKGKSVSQTSIPVVDQLSHGLKHRRARAASTQPLQHGLTKNEISSGPQHVDDNIDDSDEVVDDNSDDELLSDEFDSDSSQKSYETLKKNKWFMAFFDSLDKLTVEEINEPARQWHCPACRGGPGATIWYPGLNPLMAHVKTKRSKRAMLHRELAELLEEELRRRGTSVVPAGEVFGKWEGLIGDVKDHEIVWPPMVVIMNTRLDKDDNDKWTGMGNQELLDYFRSYEAMKGQHSYGPQGHRGMSVLIFERSAVGYLEAEKLDKHFREQGKGREAWDRLFYPGQNRKLYGYLAAKEDMDIFNQHSQGKARLKFEMRSHQEMVLRKIKQMSEENQQLLSCKNREAAEQRNSKVLEESLGVVSEKYRKTLEEIRILRLRIKMHHEQSKEEMEFQDQFYKDQFKIIDEATDENKESFELMQMSEENEQLLSCKNREAEEQRHSKVLEESLGAVKEKYRKTLEEIRILRLRIKMQHEQSKEEMDFQEQFYKDQLKIIDEATDENKESFELMQMSEENEQLLLCKNREAEEQRHSKVLEESLCAVKEKYRKTLEEIRILRLRIKMQHEQSKEEMDFQEQFFKDQLNISHEARDENKESFELMQQEEHQNVEQSNANPPPVGFQPVSTIRGVLEDGVIHMYEVARLALTRLVGDPHSVPPEVMVALEEIRTVGERSLQVVHANQRLDGAVPSSTVFVPW